MCAGEPNASDLYRYAPWFAAAWIPLTYLPHDAVVAGWVGLMVAAALATTLPLLWRGPTGWAAFAIFMPLQLQGAIFGNVQPLLVLMLMWGVERRSGPLWVAVGASLKAVPLVLALVYAGRGELGKAAWSLALTGDTVAPMLLFDLASYPTEPRPEPAEPGGRLAVAVHPGGRREPRGTYLLARTPYRWLAGAVAMVASLPRLLTYEAGFLLIGLPFRRVPEAEKAA